MDNRHFFPSVQTDSISCKDKLVIRDTACQFTSVQGIPCHDDRGLKTVTDQIIRIHFIQSTVHECLQKLNKLNVTSGFQSLETLISTGHVFTGLKFVKKDFKECTDTA